MRRPWGPGVYDPSALDRVGGWRGREIAPMQAAVAAHERTQASTAAAEAPENALAPCHQRPPPTKAFQPSAWRRWWRRGVRARARPRDGAAAGGGGRPRASRAPPFREHRGGHRRRRQGAALELWESGCRLSAIRSEKARSRTFSRSAAALCRRPDAALAAKALFAYRDIARARRCPLDKAVTHREAHARTPGGAGRRRRPNASMAPRLRPVLNRARARRSPPSPALRARRFSPATNS